MLPDFWAKAGEPTSAPATKALAVTSVLSSRAICVSKELPVEPQFFIARAVINAVDHNGQALHLRIPAGGGAVVVDHRSGAVLLQLLVDLPHEALALFRIGFHAFSSSTFLPASLGSLEPLFFHPHVFHAPAVVHAVDHCR